MSIIRNFFYGRVDVENLTLTERSSAMRCATISACFGSLAQLILGESGLVILYARKLDAGDFVSLCTSSLQMLCYFVLIFPIAFLMQRFGVKRIMQPTFVVSIAAFLLAAGASFFGAWAKWVLLASLSVYSITTAFYASGWFPLLSDVVPPTHRGRFFGTMRLSWQTSVLVFILISSLFIGKDAPIWKIQIIMGTAGIATLGRLFFISRIPEFKQRMNETSFWESLGAIIGNAPLVGFSVYTFWLYLFAGATMPVTVLFCKVELKMVDDLIVALSCFNMIGAITGYFFVGGIVDRIGTKGVFLITHFSFGVLNLLLLLAFQGAAWSQYLVFAVVTLFGLVFASASVAVSSEMFGLIGVDFKNLSIAFCFGMYSAGIGVARLASGWVLESGILAPTWQFAGFTFSKFHALFLFFGFGVIVSCSLLSLVPAVVRRVAIVPGRY